MSNTDALRSVGAKATGGTLTLLLVWWAISLILSPAIIVYSFVGVEWAALTLITTLGVFAFIVKFGPHLLARCIAKIVVEDVRAAAKDIEEREQ